MKRVIALVDCNNFFVACEKLLNPELKGKAVCVLSNNDACVVSRSNEAKKMGVPMGAPYSTAKYQFKDCIFLSGRKGTYQEISNRIMKKLFDYTPDVEIYSIDEAFLDLTGMNKTFSLDYREIIEKIVKEIYDEIGVDVSVGLSYSKVLAKLASDKAKEIQKEALEFSLSNMTYIIGYRDIERELKNTDAKEIWGIGRNRHSLFKRYLINTAWDFTRQDDFWIKKNMGKTGLDLKQELLGNSIDPVNPEYQAPKSVSRSESFKNISRNKNFILRELNRHIHDVCKILRQENLFANYAFIFLRTKERKTISAKIELEKPSNVEFSFTKEAKVLLEEIFDEDLSYRACGFWAAGLKVLGDEQLTFFEDKKTKKKEALSKVWDKLEEKFGKSTVTMGSVKDLK